MLIFQGVRESRPMGGLVQRGGYRIHHLCWILTPLPGPVGPIWPTQICASNFGLGCNDVIILPSTLQALALV